MYVYVNDRIVKTHIFGFLVKSPASSGIPQEGVDFPGVQFLGATSRQKPSYRHPRARVLLHVLIYYMYTWLSCNVHVCKFLNSRLAAKAAQIE